MYDKKRREETGGSIEQANFSARWLCVCVWTGRQIEMAARSRAASAAANFPSRPAVVVDDGHFSDSASSLDGGGSDDESQLLYAAAAAAPGAAGSSSAQTAKRGSVTDGAGRRRRSGGIPSLISRHGSRSNLGVENGISRAHEISRSDRAQNKRKEKKREEREKWLALPKF